MPTDVEQTAITTEMKASTLYWLRYKKPLLIFAFIAIVDCVWFAFNFISAIERTSIMMVFLVFLHGIPFVPCTAFCIEYLKSICYVAKTKCIVKTVLYADKMIMRYKNLFACSEENHTYGYFTKNRETKKYFFVKVPSGTANAIKKCGLSVEQLNAVRRLFNLPIAVGGEAELPAYPESAALAQADAMKACETSKAIKTSFSEFYSRENAMIRPQLIVSSIGIALVSLGLILVAAMYYAATETLVELVPLFESMLWLCAVALMALSVWLLIILLTRNAASKTSDDGTTNENLIFADCIIVRTTTPNSFSLMKIPYGKIIRVRETKDDIWIDYPRKRTTYVIVKNTLSTDEYNTLLKLLSRNTPPDANILELDDAPELDIHA